jgi:hypothetical protein
MNVLFLERGKKLLWNAKFLFIPALEQWFSTFFSWGPLKQIKAEFAAFASLLNSYRL